MLARHELSRKKLEIRSFVCSSFRMHNIQVNRWTNFKRMRIFFCSYSLSNKLVEGLFFVSFRKGDFVFWQECTNYLLAKRKHLSDVSVRVLGVQVKIKENNGTKRVILKGERGKKIKQKWRKSKTKEQVRYFPVNFYYLSFFADPGPVICFPVKRRIQLANFHYSLFSLYYKWYWI